MLEELAPDETVELLTNIVGASEEDPNLSALSAALKSTLGLSDLERPPNSMSLGVELLTCEVQSCRGIRVSPKDACLSLFHPRVRMVSLCTVSEIPAAEMKGYGLAALAPLAITDPSTTTGATRTTGESGRGPKAIGTANSQIAVADFDSKNLPERAKEFSEFLLLTGQQNADVRTKCTLIKASCKRKFLQRQVKTTIRKSPSWGDFFKRLVQVYPVFETGLSVRTESEGLPMLPKFFTGARILESVAQLEELIKRMSPTSYGPSEPRFLLVGKMSPKTRDNSTDTSEMKRRTHSYDDLIYRMIELAVERENDSHMDKYIRKHLRSETPFERNARGRSSQPNPNYGNGRGGQLKNMQETPCANGKGVLNHFYFPPTDDK